MEIVPRPSVANLTSLEAGSLFEGEVDNRIRFCVRTQSADEPDAIGSAAILGPFENGDSNPWLWKPAEAGPVLNYGKAWGCEPDMAPEHISFGSVETTATTGSLLLVREANFLQLEDREHDRPIYLNLSTGMLTSVAPSGPTAAIGRWDIFLTTDQRTEPIRLLTVNAR